MNGRQAAKFAAYRRAADYIRNDERLLAIVSRSNALELLDHHLQKLEGAMKESAIARRDGPRLTSQIRFLRGLLESRLEHVRLVADYAHRNDPWPVSFSVRHSDAIRLQFEAHGIVSVIEANIDEYLRAGLHRDATSEIRMLTAKICELELERTMQRMSTNAGEVGTVDDLDGAEQVMANIRGQIEPLMSGEQKAQWRSLLALGRSHRPAAIAAAAPIQQRASDGHDETKTIGAESPASMAQSISRAVRRMVSGG